MAPVRLFIFYSLWIFCFVERIPEFSDHFDFSLCERSFLVWLPTSFTKDAQSDLCGKVGVAFQAELQRFYFSFRLCRRHPVYNLFGCRRDCFGRIPSVLIESFPALQAVLAAQVALAFRFSFLMAVHALSGGAHPFPSVFVVPPAAGLTVWAIYALIIRSERYFAAVAFFCVLVHSFFLGYCQCGYFCRCSLRHFSHLAIGLPLA